VAGIGFLEGLANRRRRRAFLPFAYATQRMLLECCFASGNWIPYVLLLNIPVWNLLDKFLLKKNGMARPGLAPDGPKMESNKIASVQYLNLIAQARNISR
jgi:hypothetical protein